MPLVSGIASSHSFSVMAASQASRVTEQATFRRLGHGRLSAGALGDPPCSVNRPRLCVQLRSSNGGCAAPITSLKWFGGDPPLDLLRRRLRRGQQPTAAGHPLQVAAWRPQAIFRPVKHRVFAGETGRTGVRQLWGSVIFLRKWYITIVRQSCRPSPPFAGPISPESWPGDGSITSGVPKKARHCRQAGAMLLVIPVGSKKT
jgi:hypothetical protein